MKNKKYPIWSAISVIAVIVSSVALVPILTIGFADRGTQIGYFTVLALLFIFTFVSLFLMIHYKGKLGPKSITQTGQASRKLNKYVIVTILTIILLIAAFSAWSSF